MTVSKRFAPDGGELDPCMDQLVEVLAQLLQLPEDPEEEGAIPSMIDLHSPGPRAIHVMENSSDK